MTLLILAAGMGSRFGGLKQIEPVGPNKEFIIDYSIYDAIKCGFDKVVFVIKRENYDVFRETIGKRIEGKIKVAYVFQENNIPEVPKDRIKPLGTGHAILCAEDEIDDDFIIINADDFYGYDAFRVVSDFIKNNHDENKYAIVGYEVYNTITLNGQVKRGFLNRDASNNLLNIKESYVEYEGEKIKVTPFDNSGSFYAKEDDLVSMNMIAFKKSLFKALNRDFKEFIKNSDLSKDEFLIPDVICRQIINNEIKCEILHTNAVWKGITYSSDLPELKEYIKEQIEKGIYPNSL